MWHHELGKSTFDIYEEERLAKLAAEQERNAHLTDVATVLRALESKRLLEEEDSKATQDMIEEGGPVTEREEGELRFGVLVTEADMTELQDGLNTVAEAERRALDEITNNPHVIGGKHE